MPCGTIQFASLEPGESYIDIRVNLLLVFNFKDRQAMDNASEHFATIEISEQPIINTPETFYTPFPIFKGCLLNHITLSL